MYFLSLSSSYFLFAFSGQLEVFSLNGLVFPDRANVLAFWFVSEF